MPIPLSFDKSTLEDSGMVCLNVHLEDVGGSVKLFSGEYVVELKDITIAGRKTDLGEPGTSPRVIAVREVDKSESILTVGKVLEEVGNIISAGGCANEGRANLGVLVDGDKLTVCEKILSLFSHVTNVATDHKRLREHTPDGEVCSVLCVSTSAIADVTLAVHTADKHIHIIEAGGTGETHIVLLLLVDGLYRLKVILNIEG